MGGCISPASNVAVPDATIATSLAPTASGTRSWVKSVDRAFPAKGASIKWRRIPDVARGNAVFAIPPLLEGQDAQHAIDVTGDLFHSARPPRPEHRAHVVRH